MTSPGLPISIDLHSRPTAHLHRDPIDRREASGEAAEIGDHSDRPDSTEAGDLRFESPAAPGVVDLDRFAPISLRELGTDSLLDRVDRKYILPDSVIPEIVARLSSEYRVLEVGGYRRSPYTSVYYDTPDFRFYYDHHSGRSPRFKVRIRSYVSSGEEYLEVKRRSRGGRTQKYRFPFHAVRKDPPGVLADTNPFGLADQIDVRELIPALTLRYDRTTLVGRGGRERVTIDQAVSCERGGQTQEFGGVAVLEVKQAQAFESEVLDVLRKMGLRPAGISKYCLCVASLEPGVKKNRFRPALRKVAEAAESSGATN